MSPCHFRLSGTVPCSVITFWLPDLFGNGSLTSQSCYSVDFSSRPCEIYPNDRSMLPRGRWRSAGVAIDIETEIHQTAGQGGRLNWNGFRLFTLFQVAARNPSRNNHSFNFLAGFPRVIWDKYIFYISSDDDMCWEYDTCTPSSLSSFCFPIELRFLFACRVFLHTTTILGIGSIESVYVYCLKAIYCIFFFGVGAKKPC